LCNNLFKYGINLRNEGKENYFKNQVFNIINICETYKTCLKYANTLRDEYEELKIKKENLFESTDYLKGYDLKVN